jgi:hypothetical protein
MTKTQIAFLLQLDESTDKSGLAVLFVFVHYLFQNKTEYDILLNVQCLNFFHFPQLSCKTGFSKNAATIPKYDYSLDVITDMRIQLSTNTPNFKGHSDMNKQLHSSHKQPVI